MSHPMPLTRLDEVGRRLLPLIKYGPYVVLGVLVIFTVAARYASGISLAIDLALCGLAAAWMLWMFTLHPSWRVRPRVMAVFFTVFTVIMAVLVIRDPWFGFFAPAGYLYAFTILPWPWRLPGVAAVAAVAAVAQTGGVHRVTLFGVIIYAAVLAINVVPMCGLAWMDWTGDMHAEQREQAMAELREANRRLEATLAENAGLHEQLLTQAREAGVLDERQRMAGATRVGLTLSYMDHEVALDVRDDGQGFDPGRLTGKILRNEPAPASPAPGRPGRPGTGKADPGGGPGPAGGGFGLAAMRQRIEGLSGTLQVESEPGGGTAISACVPVTVPATVPAAGAGVPA